MNGFKSDEMYTSISLIVDTTSKGSSERHNCTGEMLRFPKDIVLHLLKAILSCQVRDQS